MHVEEMIGRHPDVQGSTNPALIKCIEECYDCAQTCTSCADACAAEEMVAKLRQCIRTNLDCADICNAAGHVASRRTGSSEEVLLGLLDACETACAVCAEECEMHAAMHDHCRVCAEACRRCETACQEAAASIAMRH
jgi:hypothetical protein